MTKIEIDLKALNDTELYDLKFRINQEIQKRTETNAPQELLEGVLRDDSFKDYAPQIEWLVFGTEHWDDGYFFTEAEGAAVLKDGSVVLMQLEDSLMHEVLTDLSANAVFENGALDDHDAVLLNVRTGSIEYTSWYTIRTKFNFDLSV